MPDKICRLLTKGTRAATISNIRCGSRLLFITRLLFIICAPDIPDTSHHFFLRASGIPQRAVTASSSALVMGITVP